MSDQWVRKHVVLEGNDQRWNSTVITFWLRIGLKIVTEAITGRIGAPVAALRIAIYQKE